MVPWWPSPSPAGHVTPEEFAPRPCFIDNGGHGVLLTAVDAPPSIVAVRIYKRTIVPLQHELEGLGAVK
eukprot:CAMPEP_0171123366 /NCGR_PEP_ID=MMETSP0766_2-20121228/106989_1 /TAXON_ID=439317 /ORGANISM="Gambierdiscus australes, Strain CAWD 149" /LENGTH=68 /DNA_ID=CAMNT_0011586233 /DNA_START=161 /DNA_END=364 /DNA_ORIENTATION=-